MKQDTRAALIRAGKKSFARYGYDGAAIREITRLARTNLGAVTYHFGTKRDFYHAVLETASQPLADATLAAVRSGGTPTERLHAVVRAYFECITGDQDIGRLILHELVLTKTPDFSALPIRHIHSALVALVKDGQQRGDFRDGDPALLALSIISGPLHMNLIRRVLKAGFGLDLDEAATREHVLAHLTAFASAGLARKG